MHVYTSCFWDLIDSRFLSIPSRHEEDPLPVPPRSRDPSRSCTQCERKGHDVTECFLLHGYTERFHEQQHQKSNSTSQQGGRGWVRANATHTTDQIALLISLLQNQQINLSTGVSPLIVVAWFVHRVFILDCTFVTFLDLELTKFL